MSDASESTSVLSPVPPPLVHPPISRPGIEHALERLGPLLWLLGVLTFEVGTWMGERLRFPGDTAFQMVLVLAFLAVGVKLRQSDRVDAARLALILSGLLVGYGIERWLLDAIPWFQVGNAPWPGERYLARTVHEVLGVALHVGPAIALLLWTGWRPTDFRLRWGNLRAFSRSRGAQLTAGALVLVVLGLLVVRLGGLIALPVAFELRPPLVGLAAIYALANALGAEVLYRGIVLSVLLPVLGAERSNWVQSLSYGFGFLLYTGLALGLPGLAVGAGAVLVSYIFGRAALVTGGIGLLVLIHALATFLIEIPAL